ncbi:ubiquinol-cytochrome c reductase iron-sulfur subunit [Halarchaeum sp. P4]|uniref:QcrA and Rieske domain-containing protein n=1 Tax=Halarchaeum sp. P4 TaxID=3421639 RepID=UPI003EBF845C
MSTNDDTDAETGTEAQPAYEEDRLQTTRRNAAKFFAALGGAAAVGTFAVSGLYGLNESALSGGPDYNYKTLYTQGTRLVDGEGNPIAVDAIEEGSGKSMTVFPEKEGGGALQVPVANTLLVRFTEDDYQEPTMLEGTAQGYAAYSAVCTHAGCTVSSRTGPNNQNFLCPCHQSVFNPLQGAKVVGGPAPRPLPQLPVGVTEEGDQLIIATGPFEAHIGAE